MRGLAAVAALVAAGAVARADGGAVLVLPVEGAPRSLEERLLVALDGGGRHALALRDVAVGARIRLPAGVERCAAPDCLGRLHEASGAGRVLDARLVGGTLFAALYDAARGSLIRRGAWDATHPALVEAVAAWERGAPQPSAVPLVAVEVAGVPSVEGDALGAAVAAAFADLGLAAAPPGAPASAAALRARITVEQAGAVTRVRHVHRRRSAALAATVTVADGRTGAVLFTHRAAAALDERARDGSDAGAMARLVADAARELGDALRARFTGRIR